MRRPFLSGLLRGCSDGRALNRRIPRKNPDITIPIQDAMKRAADFCVLMHVEGSCEGDYALVLRGVL